MAEADPLHFLNLPVEIVTLVTNNLPIAVRMPDPSQYSKHFQPNKLHQRMMPCLPVVWQG
jgi:hypothetical protein